MSGESLPNPWSGTQMIENVAQSKMETIYNKMSKSVHGSWVVDPMSELSLFVYNKSHVTLYAKLTPKG